jgi:hypothetical protein
MARIMLVDLCHARSGDKGRDCTVGVIVWDKRAYEILVQRLTSEVVARHFGDLVRGKVRRYLLPRICSFSFVLEDALDGGGIRSRRIDAQGKAMCEAMLRIEIEIPDELAQTLKRRDWAWADGEQEEPRIEPMASP